MENIEQPQQLSTPEKEVDYYRGIVKRYKENKEAKENKIADFVQSLEESFRKIRAEKLTGIRDLNIYKNIEEELRNNPENPRLYVLFHLLIGSTPSDSASLDFPDSRIAKFIEEELQIKEEL
jgi:hypothetical protein